MSTMPALKISTSRWTEAKRFRIVQRAVRRHEFEVGPGEELLGRRAVVVRKSGQRFDLPVSESLADGHLAKRSGSALLRFAVPASDARQRTDVGKDFTRSHCASVLLSGRQRRTDHA